MANSASTFSTQCGQTTALPLHTTIDDWLVGRSEAVARQLDAHVALGISHFMLWFLDCPSVDGLKLFAEQVRPAQGSAL